MTLSAVSFGRVQRIAVVRYVLILTAMSLVWEFAQMPLYTLGPTGTVGEIVYSALNCTIGDATIGGTAIVVAVRSVGGAGWPKAGRTRVLFTATAIGLGYTVFSEWLNVEVLRSWAYSDLMPVLPLIGTGVTPVLQWAVIPVIAYFCALIGFGEKRGWDSTVKP